MQPHPLTIVAPRGDNNTSLKANESFYGPLHQVWNLWLPVPNPQTLPWRVWDVQPPINDAHLMPVMGCFGITKGFAFMLEHTRKYSVPNILYLPCTALCT